MTIEKGTPWGEPTVTPAGTPVFASCAALGAHLETNLTVEAVDSSPSSRGYVLQDETFLALLGADRSDNGRAVRIPIDVFEVTYAFENGSGHTVAVDHVLLGTRLLRDELTLVSNTGFWRSRRVAPRAHPNDGRADVITLAHRMGVRQRLLAWRRTRWGTHLPHPAISVEQRAEYRWTGPARLLTVDGVHKGHVRSLHVRVIADALVVYV